MRQAAKIKTRMQGNLKIYMVSYRRKIIGQWLHPATAVKYANERENWLGTGYVHSLAALLSPTHLKEAA